MIVVSVASADSSTTSAPETASPASSVTRPETEVWVSVSTETVAVSPSAMTTVRKAEPSSPATVSR